MKKNIRNVISVVMVCILFLGCGKGFHYILVDDTSSFTRVMMHELYETEENIDILFVGSSHVYRSLNPQITDNIFETYIFNAGSSGQCLDGSFALIKEAIKGNEIKKIYLECYFGVLESQNYESRTQMTATYLISDYMKWSFDKFVYLWNASGKEYYIDSFIPARRHWQKFFDSEYVMELIAKKQSDTYKSYKLEKDESVSFYVERGYVENRKIYSEDEIWSKDAYGKIEIEHISDDWKNSFSDIIHLCDKENIELVLYMAPMPESTLVGKGNYDEYSLYIRNLAEQNNLNFYDFNYCKETYFDISNRALFMDDDHLNNVGAEKFSTLFAEFFMGKIKEEDLFYNSLEEKILGKEPIIYGIAGPIKDEETGLNHAKIICNVDNGVEFKITVKSQDGTIRCLWEFCENKEFVFSDEEQIVQIEWRIFENGSFYENCIAIN